MKPIRVPRAAVIGYFALLLLLALWRGWQGWRAASTPVDCTDGPCDAGVDYGSLGLQAGSLGFVVTLAVGLALFAAAMFVLKTLAKSAPPPGPPGA
jgi:hypothetical protein